jgi:hypothetical protein
MQDLDNMCLLAEIELDGNPVMNQASYIKDEIMRMIPMIEVINDEIINDPGERFKRERLKI